MIRIFTVSVILSLALFTAGAAAPDAGAMISQAVKSFEVLQDYTCSLTREELIGNRMVRQENIVYKFRKPFSVYMKWTSGNEKGTEAIFPRPGRPDRLIAHPGKFNIMNFTLDPRGHIAMKNSRHSIFESPVGYLLGRIKDDYERSKQRGEGRIHFAGEEVVDGRKTFQFSGEFPETGGYYASRVLVNFYKGTALPARVAVYGADGRLLEKYDYAGLRTNVGLTETDFNPENQAYEF